MLLGGLFIGLGLLLRGNKSSLSRQQSPGMPTIMRQDGPRDVSQSPGQTPLAAAGSDAPAAALAKPGDAATLSGDRRKYILDGDGRGRGGHGSGRNTPGKSEFPPDWSDDKVVEAIKDVANDSASDRVPADGGRTIVKGTRDGVDIEVIIGAIKRRLSRLTQLILQQMEGDNLV